MNAPGGRGPCWLDRPELTVSMAEVRSSLALAAGLAEAEKPRGRSKP